MRTRTSLNFLFLLFLIVIVLAPPLQAQFTPQRTSSGQPQPPTAFSVLVAGAWLGEGEFSVDLGCDGIFEIGPIPVTDLQMFGVAGSHIVTNPGNPNTNLGTWEKTGPRQITGRDVSFAVDATPGGAVTTIAVISFVFDFDRHFENATSTFGAKVYLPDQDPLDPLEQPVACSAGQHTSMRKVSAIE